MTRGWPSRTIRLSLGRFTTAADIDQAATDQNGLRQCSGILGDRA
jgi:cysteine sulfinate desulfinase/cysteine desulfurase-like protein